VNSPIVAALLPPFNYFSWYSLSTYRQKKLFNLGPFLLSARFEPIHILYPAQRVENTGEFGRSARNLVFYSPARFTLRVDRSAWRRKAGAHKQTNLFAHREFHFTPTPFCPFAYRGCIFSTNHASLNYKISINIRKNKIEPKIMASNSAAVSLSGLIYYLHFLNLIRTLCLERGKKRAWEMGCQKLRSEIEWAAIEVALTLNIFSCQ